MEKIFEIVKDNKYIPIDYSSKINSIKDFKDIILDKFIDKKYDKVVFILSVKELNIDIIELLLYLKMLHKIDKNQILLFNRKNCQYCCKSNISKAYISSFLNSDGMCSICFETNKRQNHKCSTCCIITCSDCKRNLINSNNSCYVCKQQYI